jgi:hypothetical protein
MTANEVTTTEMNMLRRCLANELTKQIPVSEEDVKTFIDLKAAEYRAKTRTQDFLRSIIDDKDKFNHR